MLIRKLYCSILLSNLSSFIDLKTGNIAVKSQDQSSFYTTFSFFIVIKPYSFWRQVKKGKTGENDREEINRYLF